MMYDTYQIADASNTTNIATSTGGTTDDKLTFVTPNGGFKDTGSQTAAITLAQNQFTELEYSVIASTSASDNSPYCFRVTDAGIPLEIYAKYPEATIKLSTDFFVQRGISLIPAAVAGVTITAGVEYKAPTASTSAFIRITNTQNTGAGSTAATANQNASDVTAYISNASNLQTSVTFTHAAAAAGITRVEWEIVEYKGPAGGANEIKVRQQEIVTYGAASTTATGTAATGAINGSSTVVFITGAFDPSAARTAYNAGLVTSNWSSSTKQAVFTRATAGALAVIVSFAAVEFTGANWKVQRSEHTYTAVGSTETNAITPVNSISQTFVHVQHRTTVNSHADYGHEVWLSSVGQVSFALDAAATVPANHASVAWIIENTQTTGNTMTVTRSNGTQTGGTAPLTLLVNIGKTITDVTNSSIFANDRDNAALATWPHRGDRAADASGVEWLGLTNCRALCRNETSRNRVLEDRKRFRINKYSGCLW